jgi:hypothetical protein
MQQIFPPSANTLVIVVIAILCGGVLFGAWAFAEFDLSSYWTRVGMVVEQPVPFSHEHHVGGLGIDCRYCHTTAETSSSAGIPPTATCMTCHSQVWKDAPVLQPVRDSFLSGRPLQWNRVNATPGFVYFDHSAHVKAGVSCMECHGRVDRMPLTSKQQTLHMSWCLECHRHPEMRISAPGTEFQMPSLPPPDRAAAEKWMRGRDVETHTITSCTACHR